MTAESKGPGPFQLANTFVHLQDGGGTIPLEVTPTFWEDLSGGKFAHLGSGRLVSYFTFESDWPHWEMHPNGEELVLLLSGATDVVLEEDGGERRLALREAGSFIVIPRGTWHRAEASTATTMLFVTPGEGTEHRAR